MAPTQSNTTPKVIAHRGVRNEIPENTVASILHGINLPGIEGVEFDVELADRPVVLHQETVIPSPDFKKIVLATRDFTSRDWVSQHSAAEITQLDAGSWFNQQFSDLRVPTLKEVLAQDWLDKTAHVELKDPTFWGKRDPNWPAKIVSAVIDELLNFSKSSGINVISFNPEILREVQKRAPLLELTLALWTEWKDRHGEAIALAKMSGASTLSLPDILVLEDPSWVGKLHQAGLRLSVYPVSPARGEPEFQNWTAQSQVDKWKTLVELGVDVLISDFPRETAQFLSSLSR